MKEETLLKIALCCSLAGILVLLFVSYMTDIDRIKIKDIDEGMIGKAVKITGEVVRVRGSGSTTKIEVEDETGRVNITVFDDVEINKGNLIQVEGEVEEYKGKLEINGKTIREIDEK